MNLLLRKVLWSLRAHTESLRILVFIKLFSVCTYSIVKKPLNNLPKSQETAQVNVRTRRILDRIRSLE